MLAGFGNHHSSEAIPGALPLNQNSPQKPAFDLFAEQLSGSAFTRARAVNLFSWLYRKRPSAVQGDFKPYEHAMTEPLSALQSPNPMRWSPRAARKGRFDFIDGLVRIAGNDLLKVYLYQCNQSMKQRFFSNRDGEMLFVPYQGAIRIHTEFGKMVIEPGWIAVIPRGVVFYIELLDSTAAGYLCENGALPLTLPNLGPIGANGLAYGRHFLYPEADYDEHSQESQLICKYQDKSWITTLAHSPLDVVAWHGNYAPYCYDLSLFNTMNTVSFDHPDPSIFSVLTSESTVPGVANLDFVIFPERWMVSEHTFRPPYFHRNVMSELMGLIRGQYDAKPEGFLVGGISIHNTMTPHGPDTISHKQASECELKPEYYNNTLAFMFESCLPWLVTDSCWNHDSRQTDYSRCWSF